MSFVSVGMHAQSNLVVVKNDGLKQLFSLSTKPYMLFDDSNIQIVAQDSRANISYLDFNYFSYQGNQQEWMNTIVESANGLTLYTLTNGQKVIIGSAPKYIATNSYNTDLDENGNPFYTKSCNIITKQLGESSPYFNRLPFNSFLDVEPSTNTVQPYVAFTVPPIGSGTYDLYLVTLPLTFSDDVSEEEASKGCRLRVNMFYHAKDGGWPKTRSEVLKNPADPTGKLLNFDTNPTAVDTIFLGTKTFDADIPLAPSMLVQIQSYVATSETKTLSRHFCICGLMMKAHDEGFSTTRFVS